MKLQKHRTIYIIFFWYRGSPNSLNIVIYACNYERAHNMRRKLMVFAKFSSNYARTIKAAIFWERDKCFLFWTVSTSCAHYSRHYENKLPVDMRLLPCLSLIPLSLHREGQKANSEWWARDGKRKGELKRARQNISAAIMHAAFIKRRFFF